MKAALALPGALLLALLATAPALAQTAALTPAERTVCRSAKHCADILARHDPSEFDYGVLAEEFERLGDGGVRAMRRVADHDGAAHVEALTLRLDDPLQWAVAQQLMESRSAASRALGAMLLGHVSVEMIAVSADGPIGKLPVLTRILDEHPSEDVVTLIGTHPIEAIRPALLEALGSGDSRTAGAAYRRLHADSPDAALRALVARMRRTTNLGQAMAIGDMLGRRDRRHGGGFYGRMLDHIARDTGYPPAMRDGARLGSLRAGKTAPLTVDATFGDQLMRLHAAGADTLITAGSLSRAGDGLLPAWLALAEADPAYVPDVLSALDASTSESPLQGEFIRLGLADIRRASTVAAAIRAIEWADVARWEPELGRLSEAHPFDTVRFEARRKLERDVASADRDVPWGDHPDVIAQRTRAQYCERGDRIDLSETARQMPLVDTNPFDAPFPKTMQRRLIASAFPGRTRWLAGYDAGEWSGALLAMDYASGETTTIRDGNVNAIVPTRPVQLGQQPEALFVLTGLSHMILNEADAWTIAPDGDTALEWVAELPDPVKRLYRLDDDSLLLHFHSDDVGFQPRVEGNVRYGGWVDDHPPLILTPDGELLPGCAGEALAGEAPALFRP